MCYMALLQGLALPLQVNLFLIVNPPSWFGVILENNENNAD
jgi:hypothetical protein